jgi:asparagine synthase (glutamine-hydrolysing)
MCGIAGILSPDPAAAPAVERMLDALGHRGPDGRGVATTGQATLGHCRLAIHDLTPAGAQPFVDPARGLAAVANGEFYDYALLRDWLVMRGHAFQSRSDSELLIPLWREKGPALVHDLHGPFALAVADANAGTLFLARDRVGKKPLFWARSGDRVLFSSELAALRRELDAPLRRRAVVEVLRMGYVAAPATPFEGIRAVQPGGAVLVQGGEVLERTWWTPPARIDDAIDAAAAATLVETELRAAVERRLSSERPIGALLSGGLDSAAVLLLANEVSDTPIPAFTLGFDDEVDETPFARAVAKALGSPHTVFRFDDDPAAVLQDLLSETGEMLADPSWIAWGSLCRQAADHAVVFLTGDGGDEALIGYRRHRAARVASRVPSPLRALARGISHFPFGRAWSRSLAAAGADSRAALADLAGLAPWSTVARFLQPEWVRAGDPLAALYEGVDEVPDPAADAARLDLLTYLPGDLMPKADRGAMAFGIETRSPFLDDAFLEAVLRIPGPVRASASEGKKPLRALLLNRVPASVLDRPKHGFSVPLARWLRSGPLADLARELLNDVRAPFEGVLEGDSARGLWSAFERGAEIEPLVYAALVVALHHATFPSATFATPASG